MADVGLLLRESFFCGVENRGVLTCCPREGIINKEQARFENGSMIDMKCGIYDNDKDRDKVAQTKTERCSLLKVVVLMYCPTESNVWGTAY